MEHLFNINDFNNILDDITDEEIEKYENTVVNNTLISWAKNNCKENYLTLKKQSLIDSTVNKFASDEYLEEYFNIWNYSTDQLRAAFGYWGEANSASLATNDWAKNATFVVSNKNLYIINSSKTFDYISTDIINFNNLQSLNKINLYAKKNEEVLEIKFNSRPRKLYKTDTTHLSTLFNELDQKNIFNNKFSYLKNKSTPKGLFHYITYLYILIAILIMIGLLYTFLK